LENSEFFKIHPGDSMKIIFGVGDNKLPATFDKNWHMLEHSQI